MRSIASIVCSISGAVVSLPNEKRMAEAADSGDRPIASRTWEATHGADHASRATRGADPLEIERHEKCFRGKAGETDIECVGKARRLPGVQLRCGENAFDAPPQLVPQAGLAFLFVRQVAQRFLRGHGHPDDRRNILGSRTALAFVGSAELDAIDRQTGAEIKKAGPFRSVKLVRAKACGIDPGQCWSATFQTIAPCRCAGGHRAPGNAPRFPPSAERHRSRCSPS